MTKITSLILAVFLGMFAATANAGEIVRQLTPAKSAPFVNQCFKQSDEIGYLPWSGPQVNNPDLTFLYNTNVTKQELGNSGKYFTVGVIIEVGVKQTTIFETKIVPIHILCHIDEKTGKIRSRVQTREPKFKEWLNHD